MIILKLGGSVITHKERYAALNEEVLNSISVELADASSDSMVVVHGAGSFGHMLARKYGLTNPQKDASLPRGIAEVQRDVRTLNLYVLNSLISSGIPAVSIPPAVCAGLDNGSLSRMDMAYFREFLELGNAPVSFGDVVPDSVRGVSILSGDTIMEALAQEFHPEKAVFVLDVDGLFDRSPGEKGAVLYRELTPSELEGILKNKPLNSIARSGVVDITGSIRGKMESALRIARGGIDTYLVNGTVNGRLRDVLLNRPTISTRIKGETK